MITYRVRNLNIPAELIRTEDTINDNLPAKKSLESIISYIQ